MKKLLVTGAAGLIGSEVVASFAAHGWKVRGVDNNMRADFFGPAGDTTWNNRRMQEDFPHYDCVDVDIRDRAALIDVIARYQPDAVVHTAAQPSHDLAASRPFDDFDVNAVGTLNLLEAVRRYSTEIPFVHLSTNKVYGDRPNTLELVELDTRWDFADPAHAQGIREDFPIDQSKHSVFGASKVAADVMVQEYGRYFGMPTCCLRGWLPHRSESLRRRAARLHQLPDPLQSRRAGVHDLRLWWQAGARQHPLLRRGCVHSCLHRQPARGRGLQPWGVAGTIRSRFSRPSS